jgi:hydrogenase expression/formation protein HypE
VVTSGAHVGDQLLVTKGVALEWTAILAYDFADVALRLGLNEDELAEARQLMDEVRVVPEAVAIAAHGATAMHDVTRGGLLETLLEIAYRSQVGIEIDAAKLPARSIISRFAEAFRFDPLRMISSGTLAAAVPPQRAADVRSALEEMRIPFAFAGQVTPGAGVRVWRDGQVEQYTGIHCEEDELARLWTIYPRGR